MEQVLDNPTRKVSPFYKRIHEIDFLRGFCILLVTMDHLLWGFQRYAYNWMVDYPNNPIFAALYRGASYYWLSPYRDLVRWFVLFLFAFISGASIAFSRNSWKRAGLMLVLWGVLASGSNLVVQLPFLKPAHAAPIDFNIIGVLAWSTLFYCLLTRRSKKAFWATVLISFFIWWTLIPYLLKAFPHLEREVYLPIFWDPSSSGHPQTDWLPLFPYFGFFFLGVLFTKFVYADRQSHIRRFEFEKPICFMGRHSLIIYLGWMVIVIGVFTLASTIIARCN